MPDRRWIRVATAATAAAVLLTHYATMRTVYEEWGTPSFGFPLPAFGYTGTSSGKVWFAPLPLTVDILTALVLAIPATIAADRVLHARLMWAFSVVGWLTTAIDLAPLLVIGWFGDVEVRARPSLHDWPVECRTAWFGRVQSSLVYEDLDDPCVRIQLERLRREP